MTGQPHTPHLPVFHRLGARARMITAVAFWGNLVAQIGIIVTGGIVRLTGSGLGCSTWPHCEPGQFTPRYHPDMGIKPFIEFGNRTLTVLVTVFALAVLVCTVTYLKDKGRGFRTLAIAPLVLTLVQALVGMLVVVLHLDPSLVAIHFIISPMLVAISSALVYRLYEGDHVIRRATHKGAQFVYWPLVATGFTVLILGTIVTGSGPHSGDATKPSRFPFNPAEIAWLHADVVWLLCGLIFGLAITVIITHAHRPTRIALWTLIALTLIQAVIGYVQYFTGLPEILVALHMLCAALFSAALAWVGASLFTWYPQGEGTAPAPDGTSLSTREARSRGASIQEGDA